MFAKGEGMGRRLDWEFGISRCKQLYMGFPGGSDDKESACNEGDPGLTLGFGRSPREGNGNPLQYSCLGKTHGQRSLVGYNPWSCKELDMTE